METYIKKMPKAELHVHFDGAGTPEVLQVCAERNGIVLPSSVRRSLEQVRVFGSMQEFVDLYNVVTSVLRTEQDFYDVMWSYLTQVAQQGVVHTEVFFDTQTYTARGMSPESVVIPLYHALQDAEKKWGITGGLILCILRNLGVADAYKTLQDSLAYKDKIVAIGLAGNETDHPALPFADIFAQARAHGYHIVAHAGEHGGPTSIRQALDVLHAERIDHGVRCMEDPLLVQELAMRGIPLTVCPLSNYYLNLCTSSHDHPLKKMMNAGLNVSIHSDDPTYFGGYIGDNYWVAYRDGGLTIDDIVQCARNSINASFIADDLKRRYFNNINEYVANVN